MTRLTGRQALVLAAGAATRFGGGKLTASWRGAPLVTWAVQAALAARVDGVTVVVGAQSTSIREALTTIQDARLSFVEAVDWSDGQAASLKAGLRSLPGSTRSVAVFLGDMPLADPVMADRLLDAIDTGAPAARPRSPTGPGHPVAFAASQFSALLDLRGVQGARDLFVLLGDQAAWFETSEVGAFLDVDRPEDLDR